MENEEKMKTKHMLALGSLIPVIFWGTLTVCGYVMGDYNHLRRLVSKLDAWAGLKQRFFHLGWSLWFIGLSRVFLRRQRDGNELGGRRKTLPCCQR